jgi:L-fuculose-phosphate aldolase
VVRGGLVVGSGGNLSAREPGSEEFWVTASGTWLDRLDGGAFVSVRISDGSVVAGDDPATTELRLHLETYRVRPDVHAIVHLHPQTAVLLTALGQPIRRITTDHVAYLRGIATVPFQRPGSEELAKAAASAVADGTDCVILANHGCSVLGPTVEMAHRRALNLEEAARLTYRSLLIQGGLPRSRPVIECPSDFVEDPGIV